MAASGAPRAAWCRERPSCRRCARRRGGPSRSTGRSRRVRSCSRCGQDVASRRVRIRRRRGRTSPSQMEKTADGAPEESGPTSASNGVPLRSHGQVPGRPVAQHAQAVGAAVPPAEQDEAAVLGDRRLVREGNDPLAGLCRRRGRERDGEEHRSDRDEDSEVSSHASGSSPAPPSVRQHAVTRVTAVSRRADDRRRLGDDDDRPVGLAEKPRRDRTVEHPARP